MKAAASHNSAKGRNRRPAAGDQLSLRYRKLARDGSRRGGAMPGAGRPAKEGRRPTPHRARPAHKAQHPVHVTLRVNAEIPSLRGEKLFKVIRHSVRAANLSTCPRLGGDRFRIVHFSVQTNHIHMIAEADGEAELSAGMTGFATRAARALNKALRRRGHVWADRYHARPMTTPRDVRNTLVYVLMNFAKHHATPAEGRRANNNRRRANAFPKARAGSLEWFIARYAANLHRRTFGVDPCSSAPYFNGFTRAPDDEQRHLWATRETPPVHAARTWLLTTGWRKHGLVPRNVA